MASTPTARLLGATTFTATDQRWFAEASHDHNPMHVDPVAARRLISGRAVVHGVHTLLHALDRWADNGAAGTPASIECEFVNPVSVGDEICFSECPHPASGTTLVATVGGLECTRVHLDAPFKPLTAPAVDAARSAPAVVRFGALAAPLADAPAGFTGRSFTLAPADAETLGRRFPGALRMLGAPRLAAVATLSQFVGMVCPGLHSVFSSLRFVPVDGAAAGDDLVFSVLRYDERFRLVSVSFDGCLRGELRAFVRPPPQAQPSMTEVAARVTAGSFTGVRAFIVGGSRGLGETVAKILAAGGGDLSVSYALGAEDAKRVAAEIGAFGAGRCTTVRLDLATGRFDQTGIDPQALDAVYFFATPRIYRKKSVVFERALFDEFVAFYAERLVALCDWLEGDGDGRKRLVYVPSTVFVTDRPRGLAEYAMAKAATEVLADELNRTLKTVRLVCQRLPRMATDQTASIAALASESSLDVMLPIVRSLHGRDAGV